MVRPTFEDMAFCECECECLEFRCRFEVLQVWVEDFVEFQSVIMRLILIFPAVLWIGCGVDVLNGRNE